MLTWVDGELVPAESARVSAFDRGLTVGDGVFETLAVAGGRPFALRRHLARLADGAARLGLDPPGGAVLHAAVEATLRANAVGAARLRITVTAGAAPVGGSRRAGAGTLIVAVGPLPPRAATADVLVVPWPRNERAVTAGVKTTSYVENAVAAAAAVRAGADEAVFADTQGRLCEGATSNVFVVLGGRLLTPTAATGCLPGVTRALVLEWCSKATPEDHPVEVLAAADEAFLTSSTRGVQPIARVDGVALPAVPGPVTARVMEVFAARADADADP